MQWVSTKVKGSAERMLALDRDPKQQLSCLAD